MTSPREVAAWIGERPTSVLAVDALLHGHGRVWEDGADVSRAALVESDLTPGELLGYGDPGTLVGLLAAVDGWTCVEVEDEGVAAELRPEVERRWGLAREVIDVVHVLESPVVVRPHPRVRPLTVDDMAALPLAADDLLPDASLVERGAAGGRVFVAIEDGVIVGQGGSLASGSRFADVGVHVASSHRLQGLATSAASGACAAVQAEGLVPVWGAGSENAASLRVAEKLGFVEVARCTYLVRAAGRR